MWPWLANVSFKIRATILKSIEAPAMVEHCKNAEQKEVVTIEGIDALTLDGRTGFLLDLEKLRDRRYVFVYLNKDDLKINE